MKVNVLLNEIVKFRQNALSNEEAWVYSAQQILNKL